MTLTAREMDRMLDEVFASVSLPQPGLRRVKGWSKTGSTQKIAEGLARGLPPKTIAADVGVSPNYVYQVKSNLARRKAREPEIEAAPNVRAIRYQLGHGYGVEDIAVRLKVSSDAVRKEIADLRATGRLRSVLNIGKRNTTK